MIPRVKINDAMKLHGGFELGDLETARLELRETQNRLSGSYARPEDRLGVISLADAREALQENLVKGKVRERELPKAGVDLEAIKINSAPRSLAEARRSLKRTQNLLAKQRRNHQ